MERERGRKGLLGSMRERGKGVRGGEGGVKEFGRERGRRREKEREESRMRGGGREGREKRGRGVKKNKKRKEW